MKYYLIAGEASGDLHASNLMRGLAAEDPQAEFRFWGGEKMAAVGGTLVHHYKEGAVMGASEVLKKAGRLLGNLRSCKRDLLAWKPDAVILIDYPGFNMRIARFAHSKGLKVFYYIAPKTWASREGRNRQLKRYVDMLYIVFPFEIPYFTQKGIPFVYKGNPLVEAIDKADRSPVCEAPSIAVLPGSRKGEISRMMPVCMEVADDLHSLPQYRDFKFLVAGAPSCEPGDYDQWTEPRKDYVSLIFGRTYGILANARAAIVNSGTASLEATLLGTPQVVCWSTSPLTAFLARKVLRVMDHIKYVSLANLIADKLIFKELIQEDFNAPAVTAELRRLMEDNAARSQMLQDYASVRDALGEGAASREFAKDMIARIKQA